MGLLLELERRVAYSSYHVRMKVAVETQVVALSDQLSYPLYQSVLVNVRVSGSPVQVDGCYDGVDLE